MQLMPGMMPLLFLSGLGTIPNRSQKIFVVNDGRGPMPNVEVEARHHDVIMKWFWLKQAGAMWYIIQPEPFRNPDTFPDTAEVSFFGSIKPKQTETDRNSAAF